jgi:hypothetical protein
VQRGNALAYLGEPAACARALEQAMDIARERRDVALLAFASVCNVVASDLLGAAEQALLHARRAVEAAEDGGSPWLRGLARSALGHAYIANGRWADALESLTAVAAAFDEEVAPLVESDTAVLLAAARLGTGDVAGALAAADGAIAVARRLHRPLSEIRAQLARAQGLLAAKDVDAVPAALDAAAARVKDTEARAFAPFVHVERARLADSKGDAAGREYELCIARGLFADMGRTDG